MHPVTNAMASILVNQGMVLGCSYLKSGSKHETCFTFILFRHPSTYVIQKMLKFGWSSRSD